MRCPTSASRAGQLREKRQQGNTQVQCLQVSSGASAVGRALFKVEDFIIVHTIPYNNKCNAFETLHVGYTEHTLICQFIMRS